MRIGIDIRALMEGKNTGVEVYLRSLLRNLFNIDKDNEYILFANSYADISKNLPDFKSANIKYKITRYPNKFFNLAQKFGFPKIEKLIGPVDLFFSPHWRVTAIKKTTPLVFTFHDLYFEMFPESFTLKRRFWHKFMNYKKAAQRADKIIAVSENTKKDLVRLYGIDESKIEVVYPGISKIEKLTTYNLQLENYFLYFGTFEPRKNIDAVIRSFRIYRARGGDKKLVLAGSAGWKTRVKIPDEIADKVEIRKNVSEQEKIRLYAGAFALLFPSFYEGFGFPVLEAAAIGKPVITSFSSSLAEIAGDFALFANPLRPEQIALCMVELERDAEYYQKLAIRGLAAVKEFDWNKTADQTLDVFRSL